MKGKATGITTYDESCSDCLDAGELVRPTVIYRIRGHKEWQQSWLSSPKLSERDILKSGPRTVDNTSAAGNHVLLISRRHGHLARRREHDAWERGSCGERRDQPEPGELAAGAALGVALPEVPHGEAEGRLALARLARAARRLLPLGRAPLPPALPHGLAATGGTR